jgi:MSHA biogenesis protein MshL
MLLMSSLRLCTYLFKAKKLVEPKSWLLLTCFIALTGCQSFLRPVDDLEHPQSAERLATLGDESGEAELEIESMQVSRSFSVRPRMDSQPLPNDGRVLNLSISNSGYIDAMRLMLAPYSIGLLVDGNPKLMERYANVVSIKLSGTLPDVIERISKTLGFFYVYNNNVLTIMPEESFILELPPALAEDTTAGLTNTMQYLGANDVYLDRLNRTVSYKTNRTGARNIEEYLSYLRRNRSILLYDMHIYQVTLSDAKANGIRWDKLAWTAKTPTSLVNSLAISATGANSESGNIVIAADKFNMSTFVTFLNRSQEWHYYRVPKETYESAKILQL